MIADNKPREPRPLVIGSKAGRWAGHCHHRKREKRRQRPELVRALVRLAREAAAIRRRPGEW